MEARQEKTRRVNIAFVERVLDVIETRADIMRAKGDAVSQGCYEFAAGELRKALKDG